VDYAKSGRSKCHTTKQLIPAGTLRLATMVKSRHYDGMQPNWHMAHAFFANSTARKRPKSVDEINGYHALRPADQAQIEAYINDYTTAKSSSKKPKGKKKSTSGDEVPVADHSSNEIVQQQQQQQHNQLKQAVRAQAATVWQIRDLISTGSNDESHDVAAMPTSLI
jgi:Poly(ADP-ribose) polymerase and DNA-Ligase Zn-finger region